MNEYQKDFGVQPLDVILELHHLKSDDLVQKSTKQLTHKQVQKARKGRRVSDNIKGKIVFALNACVPEGCFKASDLFNY